MRIISIILGWAFIQGVSISSATGQQVPDTSFRYDINYPMHPEGKGPVVVLDEAHFNFHTLGGRYAPFGQLLAQDGYVMRSGREPFTASSLFATDILVIANALADTGEWSLPAESAFTEPEIEALHAWVAEGGSLFLIADHMPFAGTAAPLALSFGFNFVNGFAALEERTAEIFSRGRHNLISNVITEGRNASERIDSIMVFTGQAFLAPEHAKVISRLGVEYEILLPEVAWEFEDTTPRISGQGFVNGAYLEYGKGRLVIMGEAAMFSAQVSGPNQNKAGMNHPGAKQNPQFLLNIMHWLDRSL